MLSLGKNGHLLRDKLIQLIEKAEFKASANQHDDDTHAHSIEHQSNTLDRSTAISNVTAVQSCTDDGSQAIDLNSKVNFPISKQIDSDTMQENNLTDEVNCASGQNVPCSCPCKVMAAELEGINLHIVILQKQLESRAQFVNESCAEISWQTSNLEKEHSQAKRRCKQLENDISLIVKVRNAEVNNLLIPFAPLRPEPCTKAEEERDSLRLALTLGHVHTYTFS